MVQAGQCEVSVSIKHTVRCAISFVIGIEMFDVDYFGS